MSAPRAATAAEPHTPQEVARRAAAVMWAADRASRGLDMELVEVGPGTATVAMTLTDRMCNGFGMGHGGLIFALADSAFAVACNSHDEKTVAQHCAITFLKPGINGRRLLATAREVSRAGRSGIYDVEVRQDGVVIAQFRGHSRVIGGSLTSGAPNGAPSRAETDTGAERAPNS